MVLIWVLEIKITLPSKFGSMQRQLKKKRCGEKIWLSLLDLNSWKFGDFCLD